MFYILECFSCGLPIGQFAYHMELAKIINFSENSSLIIELIQSILKKHSIYEKQIQDFILTSIQHFNIFHILDMENSMQLLVTQYNKIYPYPEKIIQNALQQILTQDTNIHKLFQLIYNDYNRGRRQKMLVEDGDIQDKNTVYRFLKENQFNRMCCRNSILTFNDFYQTKNAL